MIFVTAADPMLAAYLSGRDVPCPECGYNLRDLVGRRCPECGDDLALRLTLAEPRQGLLIAGLIGLSAGAGLSGLLLIYIGIQVLRRPGFGPDVWHFVGVTGGGFAVEALAVAAWLSRWRQIRRLGRPARLGLTAGAWALTLANLLIFSFSIR